MLQALIWCAHTMEFLQTKKIDNEQFVTCAGHETLLSCHQTLPLQGFEFIMHCLQHVTHLASQIQPCDSHILKHRIVQCNWLVLLLFRKNFGYMRHVHKGAVYNLADSLGRCMGVYADDQSALHLSGRFCICLGRAMTDKLA